ncbi:cytochrome C biogenesis protein ResB [Parafrankia colletiae]|uniref:Cytochrome C biogenesis protein ResB n=1 Tax=Parafrankia colletiae TaxID=573497 RepID=A0A1S1QYL4_9ACTN|nr:cytochrome c biogenesis protein ResB [Parafrankia colletiae]MCK9899479.1 cytochrome c biogenesis protein ResB [Frankia sp. Cpl3]OHV38777.1 cytochrome C biogenesis protein ResB [Parafrankia colletiae]
MTTRPTAPSGHVDGLMPDDPTVLEDPEAFDPPAPRRAADRTDPTERTERESSRDRTSTTAGDGTDGAPVAGGDAAAIPDRDATAWTSPSGSGPVEVAGAGADRSGDGRAEAGGAEAGARPVGRGGGSPYALPSDTTRRGRVGGRAGAVALIARSWRQLTSMRTALVLLFMLAVAAVPGSLLPQRNVNPMKVEEYLADHGSLAAWLDRFSFFDVFGAPWFAAIYLLLFISLIGCLWSRVRWHARALFTAPPKAPSRPGRLPGGSTWTSPFEADEAVLRARGVLRGRRFRVAVAPADARRPDGTPDHSAAAEKGYLRETGNLVFHLALVALLAGMGFGSWFGYQGTVLVITGNGFANTLISYDQYNGGELVDPVDLPPFSVMLDRFEATYQDNGQPADFRADVRYAEDRDAPTRTDTVRVNHPLAIGNAKIYLIGHGYAPHFVLRDPAGEVVWESYVPCTPRDGMFTSTCTVKIPDTGLPPLGELRVPQQLAFSGVFTPTTVLDPGHGYVSVFPAARAPGLTLTGFVGNLHLNEGIPQNVYTVDTRDMTQFTMTGPAGADRIAQVVAPNNPQQRTLTGLPGGLSLEVDGVREFATFQTKSDPFKGLVLVASVVIIAGLIASLRVRRRRVWVRATPLDGGGSTVEIGGLSRSDAQGFAAELTALTRRIRDDTAPEDVTPSAETPSTGTPGTTAPGTTTPSAATPNTTSSSTSSTTSATSEREP